MAHMSLGPHAAPGPPRAEPWGLTLVYLTDPWGTLWHFAQDTESMCKDQ